MGEIDLSSGHDDEQASLLGGALFPFFLIFNFIFTDMGDPRLSEMTWLLTHLTEIHKKEDLLTYLT